MAKTKIQPQMGLTFEDVWATIQKTQDHLDEMGKRMDESNRKWEESKKEREEADKKWHESLEEARKEREEANKKWEESREEANKKWEESNKKWEESNKKWHEANKRLEESHRRWGELSNSIGDLTEVLIAARLWEKFEGYPYDLKRAYLDVQIFDDENEQVGEIDILLSNTNWVMPVEVKRKLKAGDIEHHRKRMDLIRKYPPAEAKGKKMVGAVAGGFVPKEAREAAFAAGFFVVELTGESVALCPPPEGFKPKEW